MDRSILPWVGVSLAMLALGCGDDSNDSGDVPSEATSIPDGGLVDALSAANSSALCRRRVAAFEELVVRSHLALCTNIGLGLSAVQPDSFSCTHARNGCLQQPPLATFTAPDCAMPPKCPGVTTAEFNACIVAIETLAARLGKSSCGSSLEEVEASIDALQAGAPECATVETKCLK